MHGTTTGYDHYDWCNNADTARHVGAAAYILAKTKSTRKKNGYGGFPPAVDQSCGDD